MRLRAHRRSAVPLLMAPPRWWLVALVAALHALFFLIARQALQAAAPVPLPASPALQARFVPIRVMAPPAPPPPVALPGQHAPPPPNPVAKPAPAKVPADVPVADGAAPAELQLRDRDGQVVLPAAAASSGAEADYVQRPLQGDAQIMRHVEPVPYKATRFESDFPPPGESAGGALVRHAGEALIKTKEVDLPFGVHLKCKMLLGIPTFDCMMPPSPPSAKGGDARLSMAPAKPLAIDPKAPPPPSVKTCIDLYRAGKPLIWGCPADTPNRAVDDELRQRAAGRHADD